MTIDERLEYIAKLQQMLTLKMDVLTERTIQAMDSINRLARIAANHEDRISGLESPQ